MIYGKQCFRNCLVDNRARPYKAAALLDEKRKPWQIDEPIIPCRRVFYISRRLRQQVFSTFEYGEALLAMMSPHLAARGHMNDMSFVKPWYGDEHLLVKIYQLDIDFENIEVWAKQSGRSSVIACRSKCFSMQ